MEEVPITLTDRAAQAVLDIRAKENTPAEHVLRVGVQGGGCSGFTYVLAFDAPKETDHRFTISGVEVAIDQMSRMYLQGVEIDYVDGLGGSGFKFNNPNVKATCGCGSSFSA
jgi:iron-sulfur cluster assembly accessory protein